MQSPSQPFVLVLKLKAKSKGHNLAKREGILILFTASRVAQTTDKETRSFASSGKKSRNSHTLPDTSCPDCCTHTYYRTTASWNTTSYEHIHPTYVRTCTTKSTRSEEARHYATGAQSPYFSQAKTHAATRGRIRHHTPRLLTYTPIIFQARSLP